MKKMQKMIGLLLCAVLLLCLWGCQSEPEETVPPTTAPPEPTAQELYEQAVTALKAEDYVGLLADITRTVTVGADTYTKTSHQQITWKGWGTEELGAKIIDSTTIGDVTRRYTEVFRDGTVYMSGEGLAYVSDMEASDFQTRWLAMIPLDMSLYASVSEEDSGEGKLIRFEDASSPEVWAAPDYARLHEASGTAQISADGKLTEFCYCVTYQQGGAEIELQAEVTVNEPRGLDLTLTYPEGDDRYVYVTNPDIPWLLTEAYNYLLQFGSVTSTSSGMISSEALAASCTTVTSITASGTGDEHISSLQDVVTVELQDYQYTDTYTWEHKYVDGVYTISENGAAPETDTQVTAAGMRNMCLSSLTAIYPPPAYITGATLTDFGSICLIEMDCSVELAQAYSASLCEYLTSDSTMLNRLASSYKTTAMDYYVAINRDTGLPTACGINFGGTHTIDDVPYNMTYRMNQTIHAAGPNVRETLIGEETPESEPDEKATPVFYHVTGADGQQMWLMGTIHIGDARTGFLPQEIYDALESSSALAVEFDTEAFIQMMAEDEDLAARVVSSYLYLDGTSAADHLDPAVYAVAAKLLKAAGSNSTSLAMMKPFLWSQTIEGFYLQQGYELTSDKGMDVRLMELAREKEIKILNVESGIEQMEMLSGFSDAIQESILASTISTNCADMIYGVEDLYNLWCSGDEAALIEYLKEDTSEMTKQELALYNEYNKAMMTERNEEMLEVAKEYLESGDTVFYAVGLAHLLAEDGLVNTLREAGYAVELVTYANG